MNLDRQTLRRLIEREIGKIGEDALRKTHDDPGRQHISSTHQGHCQECGASMYEGDASCSECGAMHENVLEEGDCGCGTTPKTSVLSMKIKPNPHGCDACGMSPCGCDEFEDHPLGNFSNLDDASMSPGEAFGAGYSVAEYDHDHNNNYMAKPSLYKVAKYASKLLEMIPDGHSLDDWQRTKIAQIADDISEVYHSLDYDMHTGDL